MLHRNGLVLAMQALICVAGYMALTSMPIVARGCSGWRRRAHLAAGPVAIAFVAVVTVLSFALQAWTLGSAAPAVAAAYGTGVPTLLVIAAITEAWITPRVLQVLTG